MRTNVRLTFLIIAFVTTALLLPSAATARDAPQKKPSPPLPATGKLDLTDAEWRERLSDAEFRVLRGGETERAFSGAYWKHEEKGVYRCGACGQALYHSEQKFDSGDGWASFSGPVDDGAIENRSKTAFGKRRIDLKCSRCGGHVGFAYEEGPAPTGLRHSLNSIALVFEDEATWRQTEAKRTKPTKPAVEVPLDGGSPP